MSPVYVGMKQMNYLLCSYFKSQNLQLQCTNLKLMLMFEIKYPQTKNKVNAI